MSVIHGGVTSHSPPAIQYPREVTKKAVLYTHQALDKLFVQEDDDKEEHHVQHAQHKDEFEYKQEESPGPGTPCPSYNDYITPTYARNHHGSWRYVVQIPYEGYFTQTVQVTRCSCTLDHQSPIEHTFSHRELIEIMDEKDFKSTVKANNRAATLNENCAYLRGRCKSSPRWISLLVAEIYYPDLIYPIPASKKPKVHNAPEYISTSQKYKPRPNEKVNVGPFVRPNFNKAPTKKEDHHHKPLSPDLGPFYRPTTTEKYDQYFQSISGNDESKDSFLRTDDISVPISTDEFYEYQQYLQKVASSQRKSEKSLDEEDSEKIKIRTKRRDSFNFSPLSSQPSLLKRNKTLADYSKNPSNLKPNQNCDGYDNLGCFVCDNYPYVLKSF
ncbi:hypothetical protein GQR58_016051 [Nymphon striatum]|nr:hypothetical protein GQR58_016051 [Nymphon striatum]